LFLLGFVLYVFSLRCVGNLTSPATANEPMVDVFFYFVTFLAYYTSVSCAIVKNYGNSRRMLLW